MVCNVTINSSPTKNNIHSILQLYEHILLKMSKKNKNKRNPPVHSNGMFYKASLN